MIAGLIIGNGDLPIVVVRAIGPTLAASGIANPLLDPTIQVFNGNGATLGSNDNWKNGQTQSLFATQLNRSDDRGTALSAFSIPEITPRWSGAKTTQQVSPWSEPSGFPKSHSCPEDFPNLPSRYFPLRSL